MNLPRIENLKFDPGMILLTPGVVEFLANGHPERMLPDEERAMFLAESLASHVCGNWGDLDAEDRETMRRNLRTGATLMSSFVYHPDEEAIKIWIISDSVPPERPELRTATTVLLPSEY